MKVNKSKEATRATNGSGTIVKHGKYWQARWMINGKMISRSLKTEDEAEARKELARLSVQRSGQNERETLRKIQTVIASTMTDISDQMKAISIGVGELFKLFKDAPNRRAVGDRTLEVYRGQFNVLDDWIRNHHPEITNARDISQSVADEYARWRAETKSPNTHNKDLNLFGQAWRVLAQRFGLEYNPWTDEKIARLPLKPKARRNLSRKECRAILAAATTEERAMMMIALGGGYRLGDVVRMNWSDLDLAGKWVSKVNRKTGKRTSVPLVKGVLEAVLAWKKESKGGEGPVFPRMIARLKHDGDTENVSRIFSRLFRRAGIETSEKGEDGRMHPVATFHSLRHTFVTNLIEAGVDPVVVKDAVGHSVMAVTENYTHVGEKALRKALSKSIKS